MQQTPPSLKTRAPLDVPLAAKKSDGLVQTYLSRTSCLESGSRVTYAVRPTADEPFPDAYTPRGAILCTYYEKAQLLEWETR